MRALLSLVLVLSVWPCLSQERVELASSRLPSDHRAQYEDLAVRWLQEYLRIDTSNPPGNELPAARFFQTIFDAEGIENQVFEYQPNRGNIWARIPATLKPAERPLILLNHMDVVRTEPRHWKVAPFGGEIVDGALYGRGAQDMKADGLAQLMVMVMLLRERVPLRRDVIFLATSDEEVDDSGTDWMIQHHRELLGNAEFLITEGGENPLERGKVQYVGVDVAEKSPLWLRLTASGRPGHASRPNDDSAPNRLVRALNRVLDYRPEYKVLPLVAESLRDTAPLEPSDRAAYFRNVNQALHNRNFRRMVERDDSLNFMLRNTIALTMLGGSQQTNVIPTEAWANLDVRLLPGEDPAQFLNQIRRVIADPSVTVEPFKPFSAANASPTDTALFASIRHIARLYFPGAPVIPRLSSGYTENQRFRQLGVVSYGFSPYTATLEEAATEHGDDERIRLQEVRRGPRLLYDVVADLVGGR